MVVGLQISQHTAYGIQHHPDRVQDRSTPGFHLKAATAAGPWKPVCQLCCPTGAFNILEYPWPFDLCLSGCCDGKKLRFLPNFDCCLKFRQTLLIIIGIGSLRNKFLRFHTLICRSEIYGLHRSNAGQPTQFRCQFPMQVQSPSTLVLYLTFGSGNLFLVAKRSFVRSLSFLYFLFYFFFCF